MERGLGTETAPSRRRVAPFPWPGAECRRIPPLAGHLPHPIIAPQATGVERIMAHIIGQPCIGTKDASCVAVCPVDCIHPSKDEGTFESAEQLFIDPDVCIDCGL